MLSQFCTSNLPYNDPYECAKPSQMLHHGYGKETHEGTTWQASERMVSASPMRLVRKVAPTT